DAALPPFPPFPPWRPNSQSSPSPPLPPFPPSCPFPPLPPRPPAPPLAEIAIRVEKEFTSRSRVPHVRPAPQAALGHLVLLARLDRQAERNRHPMGYSSPYSRLFPRRQKN